jgi:hypothetical protein
MDSSNNIYKSKQEKQKEVLNIMKQLGHLEIGSGNEGIKQFYRECSNYIEGKTSLDGRINLTGLGRVLIYNLPQKKSREVELTLRYHKNV